MAGNKLVQTEIAGVLINSAGMDRTSIFNALQIAGSDIKDTKKVSDELYNMSKAGYVIKQSIANSAASKWLLTTAGRTEFAPLIKLSAPVVDAQVDDAVDQLIEQAAERAADAPIVIDQNLDNDTQPTVLPIVIDAAIALLQKNGFHVLNSQNAEHHEAFILATSIVELAKNIGGKFQPPPLTIKNKLQKIQVIEKIAFNNLGLFSADIINTLQAVRDDLNLIDSDENYEATA